MTWVLIVMACVGHKYTSCDLYFRRYDTAVECSQAMKNPPTEGIDRRTSLNSVQAICIDGRVIMLPDEMEF